MDYTQPKKPMSYLERYIASQGIGDALKAAGSVLGAADLGGDSPSVLEQAAGASEATVAKDMELALPGNAPPVQKGPLESETLDDASKRLRDFT